MRLPFKSKATELFHFAIAKNKRSLKSFTKTKNPCEQRRLFTANYFVFEHHARMYVHRLHSGILPGGLNVCRRALICIKI
jgi:hypothetical protein